MARLPTFITTFLSRTQVDREKVINTVQSFCRFQLFVIKEKPQKEKCTAFMTTSTME